MQAWAPRGTGGVPRPRVLYVCLQGLEHGQGASTHVGAVVDGLRRTHDVVLVAPEGTPATGLLGRALRLPRLLLAAARAARGADVVYLRHHPMLQPLTEYLRRRGVTQIQEVNGPIADFTSIYPTLRPVGALLRAMSTATLRHADRVVAVSERLARSVRHQTGLPDDQVLVVHNGADLDVFTPVDRTPVDADTVPYVVFAGALAPWQGLGVLAAATGKPDWPAGVRVVVAGAGPSRHLLDGAASEAIDDRGVLPQREVARLVAGSLASLSPKTPDARWSSPLKVYEAIAAGVPTVVTDVGEQADIVRQWGCGVVVPPGDAAALARAVRGLVDDGPTRDRLAAAALAARPGVGWDDRVRTLARLLEEATGSNPVRASRGEEAPTVVAVTGTSVARRNG